MTAFIRLIKNDGKLLSTEARTEKIVNVDIIAMVEPTKSENIVKITYKDGSEDHWFASIGHVCAVLSDTGTIATLPYTIRDP